MEGDIQRGSFTEKMTLDPIVGLNAWWSLVEIGVKQKKGPMLQVPSTIMVVGVGHKVCDTVLRPFIHLSVATSDSPNQSEHIEQTTAKLSHTCHEIW